MLNVDFFAFFTNFDGLAWLAAGRDSASQLIDWVLRKYAAAPALVLGVGVALALPAIATVGAILRLFPGGQPKRVREPRTQRTLPPSA